MIEFIEFWVGQFVYVWSNYWYIMLCCALFAAGMAARS